MNIIIATLNNDFELLHHLLNHLDIESQKLGNLREFVDINFQEQTYGNTALHYAVKRGNFKMVETLLFYGADRNIKNFSGILPMDEYENHTIDPLFYYQDEFILVVNDSKDRYQSSRVLKNIK
jgi:ankyrin repeat protein